MKNELYQMIDKLQDWQIEVAKTFLAFLIEQQQKIADKQSRISLSGIMDGSQVTEDDFREVKKEDKKPDGHKKESFPGFGSMPWLKGFDEKEMQKAKKAIRKKKGE